MKANIRNEAVKYFNTNHKSIPAPQRILPIHFPRVIWHSETPMIRTAPAPMLLLSKLVRENNIKVVITGEGSDEILAGYDIFKEAIIRRFWASQPDSDIDLSFLKNCIPYLPHLKCQSKYS